MARTRGGDGINRRKGGGGSRGRATRPRQVYVYTEGEVTEPEYIDLIVRNGTPKKPGETVQHHIGNPNAEGKQRKPLRLVQDAVRTLRKAEREAKDAGLKKGEDWNWPQVWVLFDRDDGRLCLDASVAAEPDRARAALADWYVRAGQRWMRGRLQPWAARMDVPEPQVRVRDLRHRWGSYRAGGGGNGTILLHWATFQLPIHLVDYVVAHELAHVRVSGHGSDYWQLLSRALPESRRLKAELDDLGRRVWMGDLLGADG